MPAVKKMPVALEWSRPSVPAPHRVSDVIGLLGNRASLQTGRTWQEAGLQGIFNKIADALPRIGDVCSSAKKIMPNADLKPGLAALRCAEARRRLIESEIVSLMNELSAVVSDAWKSVDGLESRILEISAAPDASGNDLVSRKIEAGSLFPVLLKRLNGDAGKLVAFMKTALDQGRFDVLAELEKSLKLCGFDQFDFSAVRREWAIASYPELVQIVADSNAMAVFCHDRLGDVIGALRLLSYQTLRYALIDLESLPRPEFEALESLTTLNPANDVFEKESARFHAQVKAAQVSERSVAFNK